MTLPPDKSQLASEKPSTAALVILAAVLALTTSIVATRLLLLFVVCFAIFIVIISKHPKYAMYLLGLSLGLNFTLLSNPVHLSVPQIFAVAIIAAVVLRKILFSGSLTARPHTMWAWSGVLITVASLPSLAFAVAPSRAAAGMIQLLEISLLIYASVQLFVSDRVPIYRVCQFILLGATISALHALLQGALLAGPEAFLRGGMLRVYASYGQPNSYGQYLAGVIPLTLVLLARQRRYVGPFLLLCMTLLLTGSRGATLSTLAACMLVVGLYLFKHPGKATLLASTTGALIAVGLLLFPPIWLRAPVTVNDWSAQQRFLALLTAWEGISRRPFLGYGPGSFQVLISGFRVEGLTDDIEMPHNILLDIWFELGILALVVFSVLVLTYIVKTARTYTRTDDLYLLALLGAFAGLLTAAMFGTLIVRGAGEFFAIIVGMTAGRLSRYSATAAHIPSAILRAPRTPEPTRHPPGFTE